MEQRKHTAAILGGGSFGTATASILAENGHPPLGARSGNRRRH